MVFTSVADELPVVGHSGDVFAGVVWPLVGLSVPPSRTEQG